MRKFSLKCSQTRSYSTTKMWSISYNEITINTIMFMNVVCCQGGPVVQLWLLQSWLRHLLVRDRDVLFFSRIPSGTTCKSAQSISHVPPVSSVLIVYILMLSRVCPQDQVPEWWLDGGEWFLGCQYLRIKSWLVVSITMSLNIRTFLLRKFFPPSHNHHHHWTTTTNHWTSPPSKSAFEIVISHNWPVLSLASQLSSTLSLL